MFGMVERGSGRALTFRVPDRTRETLVAGLVQNFIEPGTLIISDKFSPYFNLNNSGYCLYFEALCERGRSKTNTRRKYVNAPPSWFLHVIVKIISNHLNCDLLSSFIHLSLNVTIACAHVF